LLTSKGDLFSVMFPASVPEPLMKVGSMTLKQRLRIAAVLTAVIGLLTPLTAQAQTTDAGLFGSGDPQFDGVFRQTIGLIGLNAVGVKPSASALQWLMRQQCADGSFESYRADTSKPCAPGDPQSFTGSNVQMTALGAIALYLNDRQTEARRAIVWLNGAQNDDFGFPSFRGGESDANSTGLALAALQTVQPQDRSARIPNAQRFLGTLQLRCNSGGGVSYQKNQPANVMASAQAYFGIRGVVPIAPAANLKGNPRCARNTAANIGSYLARPITSTGVLPNAFGPGPDYTSTAFAILGFISQGAGQTAVDRGTRALRTNARAYALPGGQASPAALGLLLQVAHATRNDPRNFGGVNLIRSLQSSER
jgi:hypothetical protein